MSKGVSKEPLVWFPFSGGGMLSALLIPVHIFALFIVMPVAILACPGEANPPDLLMSVLNESGFWSFLVKGYLFVLVAGCFFHAVHRFRGILIDLGAKDCGKLISLACYGGAIIGSMWAFCTMFLGWPEPPMAQ